MKTIKKSIPPRERARGIVFGVRCRKIVGSKLALRADYLYDKGENDERIFIVATRNGFTNIVYHFVEKK